MSRKKTPPQAENAAGIQQKQQRGKPFPRGVSGNPKGKSPGTRHRATLAAESLLTGEAETLTRRCVDLAKEGDSTALRLCIERIIPPIRERRIALSRFPKVRTAGDVTKALAIVLDAVAVGQLAPGEGSAVAGLLEAARRSMESNDLERRIEALEGKRNEERA